MLVAKAKLQRIENVNFCLKLELQCIANSTCSRADPGLKPVWSLYCFTKPPKSVSDRPRCQTVFAVSTMYISAR